jgi:anti-sigma regulatory factor (Ser/Thr protein kinase)
MEFTSAFSEIYNNIPIHAYEGKGKGTIEFTIHIGVDHLMVDVVDTGKSFDIDTVPPPDEFPMSGMGIHIARTMLDDLEYIAGPPNRWRLVKYLERPQERSEEQPAPPEASPPK